MAVKTLLNAVTTTQTSAVTTTEAAGLQSSTGKTVFQVTSQEGSGTCTCLLEGSIDGIGWVTIATVTITAASGAVSDGAFVDLLWTSLRARLTVIGSGAAITATIYRAGV